MTSAPAVVDKFSHEAFFYADLAEFLDVACGFVREGVDRGEMTLVATSGERLAGLRAFFGADPDVSFLDMTGLGANPARIIPAWRELVDAGRRAGRTVRGIGEPVWPGRSDDEIAECVQHESLLNLAFDDGPAWRLLCPYDAAALPGHVLQDARGTHPSVLRGGTWTPSETYHPEQSRRALRGRPLPPAPATSESLDFTSEGLGDARAAVRRAGRAADLDPERTADLELAVAEIATNSVRHSGGPGRLRLWTTADRLVCEVTDGGVIDDPLVGRVAPDVERLGGRGLWLANQLTDLVQMRSGPAGTVVRLHVLRPAT